MVICININGVMIIFFGCGNIVVLNGCVVVDGKDVIFDVKQIIIEVYGDFQLIEVDVCDCIYVIGLVGYVKIILGDVWCGDVIGLV